MNLQIEFHPKVHRETETSFQWYEKQLPGLGSEFLDEVEEVLKAITAHPAKYGFSVADIREGLLPRFPFAVYYRVLHDRIRVLAVFHTSRNPQKWQSRS